MKGSHHESVYNEAGQKIGHLRITNDGVIYSAWIHKQFLKMEFDEKYVSKLVLAETSKQCKRPKLANSANVRN